MNLWKVLEDLPCTSSRPLMYNEVMKQSNNISSYPEEMIFVLDLTKSKNIYCKGFDYKINVLKKGITKNDEFEIIKKQK